MRAAVFTLNAGSALDANLLIAGLGLSPGTTTYVNSANGALNGTLNGYTGTGNTPSDQWAADATIGREKLGFNGSDAVVCPSSATLRPNLVSVAIWHYFSTGDYIYLTDCYGDDAGSLTIQYAQTAEKAIYVTIPGVCSDQRWSIGTISGAWHHVGVSYDGSHVYLYLDGVQVGSPAAASGNCSWDASHPLLLGKRATTPLADFLMWSCGQPAAVFAALASAANVNLTCSGADLIVPTVLTNRRRRVLLAA